MKSRRITDNLDALMDVLPPSITEKLTEINRADDLLEVILDVGRVPTARFVDEEIILSEVEVEREYRLCCFAHWRVRRG
jgi:stage III sporulation protein SpoIIIAA